MNKKVSAIKSYLKELYPDQIHDYEAQDCSRFYCFYVRQSRTEQLILKITDICLDDRKVDEITTLIGTELKDVLESNVNNIVLLRKDFSYTVQEVA